MSLAMTLPPGLRMLDSDILIDVQRGHPPAAAWMAGVVLTTYVIAGFTAMELIKDARNAQEARAADRLLNLFPRVWPSRAACEAAYADFRRLHLSHRISLPDALIAATARETGAILCTFNVKHYGAVPGLVTEQPYQR